MNAALAAALGDGTAERFECSSTACRRAAAWAILWRNPKIHSEERRKTWLACDDHRDSLYSFLAARDFPIEVITVDELERR